MGKLDYAKFAESLINLESSSDLELLVDLRASAKIGKFCFAVWSWENSELYCEANGYNNWILLIQFSKNHFAPCLPARCKNYLPVYLKKNLGEIAGTAYPTLGRVYYEELQI